MRRGQGEEGEKEVGVKSGWFLGGEKQDGWAEGEERESKGQVREHFPFHPPLLPAFLSSSCEGQAWRGCGLALRLCTAPCGASHRNPINHWSRSLTPGHKDPTHCVHLHMQTHKHVAKLHFCWWKKKRASEGTEISERFHRSTRNYS